MGGCIEPPTGMEVMHEQIHFHSIWLEATPVAMTAPAINGWANN